MTSPKAALQRGFGHLAQLADGGNAAFGQRSGVHVADAVELFHRQRRQDSFFFAGYDHAKARGRSRREAMEATTLVRAAPTETLKPVRARISDCKRRSVAS